MFEKLEHVIRQVEIAEKLTPAGSYEHGRYVQAALYSAWPIIKTYVEFERRKRKMAAPSTEVNNAAKSRG